jgi:hypothetical protein
MRKKKDKNATDFFEKSSIVEKFWEKINSGEKGERTRNGLSTLKKYAEFEPEYYPACTTKGWFAKWC